MDEIKEELFNKINSKLNDLLLTSNLVEMIFDISKKTITGFTEKETIILRKKLGIFDNGIEQSLEETSKFFNCKIATITNTLCTINSKLYNKNMRYSDIETLFFSTRLCNILKRNSIYTIRYLTSLTIEDINKLKFLGKQNYNELLSKLHYFNLSFNNEIVNQDSYLEIFDLSLTCFDFSLAVLDYLFNINVKNLKNLLLLSENDLKNDSFSETIINEIKYKLSLYNLELNNSIVKKRTLSNKIQE